MVTIKYALAIAAAALALVGGIIALKNVAGGKPSPSANAASYTVTPKGRLDEQLYYSFSGPAAAMRKVERAFEAARKGEYIFIAQPVGQTHCDIAADGGKVTISVLTIVDSRQSEAQTACDWLRNRF